MFGIHQQKAHVCTLYNYNYQEMIAKRIHVDVARSHWKFCTQSFIQQYFTTGSVHA